MDLLLELRERARRSGARVVLPEATDERVVQAATRIAAEGLLQPVLVASRGMGNVPGNVEVVDPLRDGRADAFAEALHDRRKAKGMTEDQARERMRDPLMFGAALVASGDCAGGVAGSEAATADVLRAGLQVIGLQRGMKTLSSCFLMVFPGPPLGLPGACGLPRQLRCFMKASYFNLGVDPQQQDDYSFLFFLLTLFIIFVLVIFIVLIIIYCLLRIQARLL